MYAGIKSHAHEESRRDANRANCHHRVIYADARERVRASLFRLFSFLLLSIAIKVYALLDQYMHIEPAPRSRSFVHSHVRRPTRSSSLALTRAESLARASASANHSSIHKMHWRAAHAPRTYTLHIHLSLSFYLILPLSSFL